MTVSTTLKYFFLPCLLAAAIPLRAAPAPMQATSTESARIWTDGYGTGNGRLGILSFGVFPKEIVVFNEGSIFAKKKFPDEGRRRGGPGQGARTLQGRKIPERGPGVPEGYPSPRQHRGGLPAGEVSSRWNSRGFPPLPPTGARWTCSGARLPPAFNSARGELSTEILAAPSSDCAAYRITCTLPAGCRVALDLQHPDPASRIDARPDGWVTDGTGKQREAPSLKTGWPSWLPAPPYPARGKTVVLDSAREVLVLSSTSTDYNIRKPEEPLTHSLTAKNSAKFWRRRRKKAGGKNWRRKRKIIFPVS
ncbi:glycoside hydrolase family 95 protein [Akkermansia massiliensis]|uniref:glycoside hydrolase family 95 protein n=1 Tax=Akkermansia massiliensis TaxID=2927224 RepID=UPI001C0633F6|nr:glycoside hydrolase family 95 protein [Akkermansia massiliensis]QWP53895.1 hypothetical protein J5W53_01125 [Akkermansia massiliensis]